MLLDWLTWVGGGLAAIALVLFQVASYLHSGWALLRRLRLDDRRQDRQSVGDVP